MRENKSKVSDSDMEAAFRQGFTEGIEQACLELTYQLSASFEGTELKRKNFSDLREALVEAQELLSNGVGMVVSIAVYPVSTPQMTTPKAVEDGIIDAEVVDEVPSP